LGLEGPSEDEKKAEDDRKKEIMDIREKIEEMLNEILKFDGYLELYEDEPGVP